MSSLSFNQKKTYVDGVFIEKLTQCHYRRQKKSLLWVFLLSL